MLKPSLPANEKRQWFKSKIRLEGARCRAT